MNIHRHKTKILGLNTTTEHPVTLRGEPLEDVESFSYLGSTINKLGGNIWKYLELKEYHHTNQTEPFNSNIKSVLLYGSETWRSTKASTKKLQVFINKCLRRILQLVWSDRVSNIELWQRSGQTSAEEAIRRRKWKWLGHTLRKPSCTITRQALTWNPQGSQKRVRPRNTWRRSLEAEIKSMGKSRYQLERDAQDRRLWRETVDGLCS